MRKKKRERRTQAYHCRSSCQRSLGGPDYAVHTCLRAEGCVQSVPLYKSHALSASAHGLHCSEVGSAHNVAPGMCFSGSVLPEANTGKMFEVYKVL